MTVARLLISGRKPPPIGGVTRSVEATEHALRQHGVAVRVCNPRRPISVLAGLLWLRKARRRVYLANLSTPGGLFLASILTRLGGAVSIAFMHGGWIKEALGQRSVGRLLTAFDELWATDATAAAAMRNVSGRDARVTLPIRPPARATVARNGTHVITAASRGAGLYNVDLVVSAVRKWADEAHHEPRLTVVLYGGLDEHGRSLRARLRHLEWVNLFEDVDSSAVDALLQQADIFVRATDTDGDSLIVREALAAGCRVLATPVVARPQGVELFDLNEASLIEALKYGGLPSEYDDPPDVVERLMRVMASD